MLTSRDLPIKTPSCTILAGFSFILVKVNVGLSKVSLFPIQSVLNAAARLIAHLLNSPISPRL